MKISKKTLRIILMLTAILLVLGGIRLVRYVPRMQLTGRSIAHLSLVITEYIIENGCMPQNLEELEQAGFIGRTDQGEVVAKSREIRPVVLYHFEDIFVNWSVSVDDLAETDDGLIDRRTGERVWIIGVKSAFRSGNVEGSMHSSVLLYRELVSSKADDG